MLWTNIQGLKNNFDELKQIVNNRKPDICMLNETHVTENCDTSFILNLRNYNFYTCVAHSTHTAHKEK